MRSPQTDIETDGGIHSGPAVERAHDAHAVANTQGSLELFYFGSRVTTLDAKPEPITIDIAKTAVIVVDLQ